MATIIFTKDLLEGLIEYMNEEKVEALEFEEKNFIAQIKEYNEKIFGRPEDDSPLH